MATPRQFDVWENARLFALVNLAMADGFIAGFEDRYYCNYWRPVTAIRHLGDREWLSYCLPRQSPTTLRLTRFWEPVRLLPWLASSARISLAFR